MSTTYPSLDQATANLLPHTRQPREEGSVQQPSALSSYVGVHRRRDGQGRMDRPGNLRGSDTWEDSGSWWHSGSIRRSCVNAR